MSSLTIVSSTADSQNCPAPPPSQVVPINEVPAAITRAFENLQMCPASSELLQPLITGELKIQCLPDSEFSSPDDAFIRFGDRTISVPCQNDKVDLTSRLLFELLNFTKRDRFLHVNKLTCLNTPDVHAIATEKLEHETAMQHHQIVDQCVEKKIWPEEYDLFGPQFKPDTPKCWGNFTHFLDSQEFYGHTDMIRKNWYQLCASEQEYHEWLRSKIPEWQAKAALQQSSSG